MKTSIMDGLIFDMDGVLVDVSRSYREAIRLTARYFLKREVTVAEVNSIKNRVGMNNDWDATYAIINDNNIPYSIVKLYFQKMYLGDQNTEGLISNEKLLLSKAQLMGLKRRYKKLGLATGRPKMEVNLVLRNNQLEGVFDCIVAFEDVKEGKPSPESINKSISFLDLKSTVYIGDSPNDVLAANAANIPSIYIGKEEIGTLRFGSTLQVFEFLNETN